MNPLQTVLSLACFLLFVTKIATALCQPTCMDPPVRREWRDLTKWERLEYIDAVQCLMSLPSILQFVPGSLNRFDDFQATHILLEREIHYTGRFQPWHRYFVALYEEALRRECQYTGAQPYWDWTLDSTDNSTFLSSPIFDPVFGFGGNGPVVKGLHPILNREIEGSTGGGCVLDGPFKDLVLHVGPSNSVSPNEYCLTRDLNPYFATNFLRPNDVERTLFEPNFASFDESMQSDGYTSRYSIHNAGHFVAGGTLGTLSNLYSSPGDPIFYLHHANLDRIWWQWTQQDSQRLTDIAGPLEQRGPPFGNVSSLPVSLGTINHMMGLGDDITISDLMNIQGPTLCYAYES